MSTTYATLREYLSRQINDWMDGTADSGSSKNSIKDAELQDKPRQPSVGQFVLITSGTYAGQVRRISKYTEITQEIIWERPLAGAPSAADTYEVHSFDPDDLKEAINHARLAIYPYVYQYIDDATMVSREDQHKYTLPTSIKDGPFEVRLGKWASVDIDDQLLTNADFEDWTGSAPDDWDTPTNITTAQEDDWVLNGNHSCKCTATTSAASFYQTKTGHAGYAGQRMSFSIWVYCMTASRIKAAIYDASATEGDYHEGKGWEQLTVSYTMPSSPTALKAGVTVAAGTVLTFYVDEAVLWSGQRVADALGDPLYNWTNKNGVLEFPYSITSERPIRVIGMDYLSSVSADTDTMELDDPQTNLLYAEAALYLYRQYLAKTPSQGQELYGQLLGFWEGEARKQRRMVAMAVPTMKRLAPTWGL